MIVEQVPLAEIPRKLRDEYGISVTYRRLYGLVLDGVIPAKKDKIGNRWFIASNDLGKVAETITS